jgi:hypothetical protein
VVIPSVDDLASPTALLRELKRVVESRDEPGIRALLRAIPISESETNTDRAVTRIQGGDEPFRTPAGPALAPVDSVGRADAALGRLWEESPDPFQALWNAQGVLLLVL